MFQLRLKTLYQTLSRWNLFYSPQRGTNEDNEHQLKRELNSTRLFICLLFSSLIILLVYTSQVQVTQTITTNSPSVEVYLSLYEKHADTLTCPCTKIAIAQQEFISLVPTFHQVCTSDFVKSNWLSYLNGAARYYLSSSFQDTGGLLFQALSAFCNLAHDAIDDSLLKFYATHFITNNLIDVNLFNKQSQSLIELYILTTANQFIYSFDFIRDVSFGNGLISGLVTNFNFMLSSYDSTWPGYVILTPYETYDNPYKCDCSITPSCIFPAAIRDDVTNNITFTVPGIFIGCLLVEAMRQSNLQCMYNQTCIDQMKNYTRPSVPVNVTALDVSVPSQYNTSTNIDRILANLMVESWIQNVSYSAYYDQCQPSQCAYTKVGRNSAIYVITALIGLFGGLYKALYFLSPKVVKIIRRRQVPGTNTSVLEKLRSLPSQILNSIRTLNLFPSSSPSVDEYYLKTERISTFVYIISLTMGCLILLVYIATESSTQTVTANSPSFAQYQTLYDEHREKLACPCSTIANEYQDFLFINPLLHPICTSDFMDDDWINYKSRSNNTLDIYDFRRRMSATFYLLKSYCVLANNTISNALIAFNSTELISTELLSENLFHEKTQQLTQAFIQSTTKLFSYNLDSIRTTNRANLILSGLSTDTFIVLEGPVTSLDVVTYSMIYGNCTCDATSTCFSTAWIYSYNGTQFIPTFIIPGFYVGCYVDEALRKSTLECFFNQSCIDTFKFYLGVNQSVHTTALDPNLISSSNRTSLVDGIIINMMVEQWPSNDTFSTYYERCHPSSCYYTSVTTTPFIVVLTTLIGLYGGLAKVLFILVPIIIKFIRRRKQAQNSELNSEQQKKSIVQKVKETVQNLNLFRSTEPVEDVDYECQLKNELLSTRLFICLTVTSLIILLIYTSRIQVTHTITVDSASSATFSSLYETYPDTLVCPCANVAIAQEEFISVAPVFHQICNSIFADIRWPLAIDDSEATVSVYDRDFRYRGPAAFMALISLCSLSQTSITNALTDFNSTAFISKNALSEKALVTEINATINSLINTLTYNFVHSFQIIRDTTQANGLISSTLSSISFTYVDENNPNGNGSIGACKTRYKTYPKPGCSCQTSITCNQLSGVYTNYPDNTLRFTIPGFLIGCYTFEALLLSSLVCFFNQTCINILRAGINLTDNIATPALEPAKLIYFTVNSTIESMMNRMMVEQWNRNISHMSYYEQCHPIYCKYTYEQSNDILYMVTTLLALVGGLTSILQLVIPRLVQLVRKRLLKRQQRRTGVSAIS